MLTHLKVYLVSELLSIKYSWNLAFYWWVIVMTFEWPHEIVKLKSNKNSGVQQACILATSKWSLMDCEITQITELLKSAKTNRKLTPNLIPCRPVHVLKAESQM